MIWNIDVPMHENQKRKRQSVWKSPPSRDWVAKHWNNLMRCLFPPSFFSIIIAHSIVQSPEVTLCGWRGYKAFNKQTKLIVPTGIFPREIRVDSRNKASYDKGALLNFHWHFADATCQKQWQIIDTWCFTPSQPGRVISRRSKMYSYHDEVQILIH